MPYPMTRLSDRFGVNELNFHPFAPCRRAVDTAEGIPVAVQSHIIRCIYATSRCMYLDMKVGLSNRFTPGLRKAGASPVPKVERRHIPEAAAIFTERSLKMTRANLVLLPFLG